MSSSSSSSSSGIGVLGLLGVVFVTLKLIGIINWSWWWVTVPFWGGFALVLLILAGMWGYILAHRVYRLWVAKRAAKRLSKQLGREVDVKSYKD